MLWKAWIEDHRFDLEALGELFGGGDPLVAQDESGNYHVESIMLQDSDSRIDANGAQILIKRINGSGRAADSGFQPVVPTGRYTNPNGSATVVAGGAVAMGRMKVKATAVVTDSNGNTVSDPPSAPKGPRYMELASRDPDVADALRVLGNPESLDWYDIYKVWEIVEHTVGGSGQVEREVGLPSPTAIDLLLQLTILGLAVINSVTHDSKAVLAKI
jgi:hypothetical protein